MGKHRVPHRSLQIRFDACAVCKPRRTLKAIAVFYTCLTGGLRYCRKQNISVCTSRANRPMKPCIKKTFAPEKPLQRPEMGTAHECECSSNSVSSFLTFFQKHTFDLIEFADFIALHLFHGQLRGVVEKHFHEECPPQVPSRFCPPLTVCPWTRHLTSGRGEWAQEGASRFRIHRGRIKRSPVTSLSFSILGSKRHDGQPL